MAQKEEQAEETPGTDEWPFGRMTDDEIRDFVRDYLGNAIFTSASLSASEANAMMMTIFPVFTLAPADFSEKLATNAHRLGCVWEYRSKALPMGVNGYPVFFSARIMHQDDWTRCRNAIIREEERMKNLEV